MMVMIYAGAITGSLFAGNQFAKGNRLGAVVTLCTTTGLIMFLAQYA